MADSPHPVNAALLWDESFLWGLMAFKALRAAGLSFDLVSSDDIKKGRLRRHSMLFVPGGWASNKIKSLGDDGISSIREFIHAGGNYLGFCGGAGLATRDGIGLLGVKRRPTRERVPSFSGRIRLSLREHPVWRGVTNRQPTAPDSSTIFHAWWPSQFLLEDRDISVLATYGEALPDAFSSDLNVGDISAKGEWAEIEKIYGINLDPARLLNEPAVIEGRAGKGRVILSLIHFDTPEDRNGSIVLRNLWEYLSGEKTDGYDSADNREAPLPSSVVRNRETAASALETCVEELISLGTRNFLWLWRNPMLLQWRRGIRGLEYCTLYVLTKEIAGIVRSGIIGRSSNAALPDDLDERLARIAVMLGPFVSDAKKLLVMERLALQNGHITYERCDDPEMKKIRTELFSNSKSHGGLFKELIDEMDRVLFMLLTGTLN